MKISNLAVKLSILSALLVFGCSAYVLAEPEPVSSATVQESVQTQEKPELKAPVPVELTEEEKAKAEEEAKIKEELTKEQKQLGEAAPLKVEDKDFDPNANEELTKSVVPNTGMEFLKLVSMFARVMLAVLAASVIIYFLLLFVRKFFHPPLPTLSEEDFDVRDLNSPKNTDEALKSFLDRTGE